MLSYTEAVARRCSVKMVFLNFFAEFTGKPLRRSLFFYQNYRPEGCKKETPTQLFSFEFCEILKFFLALRK